MNKSFHALRQIIYLRCSGVINFPVHYPLLKTTHEVERDDCT